METILLCYLKSTRNTESTNPRVSKTSNGRIMFFYQNGQCVTVKNQDLLKNKEQADYNLGIKTLLSKILLLGDVLFLKSILLNTILITVTTTLIVVVAIY